MSSKGSGHVRLSTDGDTYADIGAALTIASMLPDGGEFWWSVTPDHDVLNDISASSDTDRVTWTMHVTGYNPEVFAWRSPPVSVAGLDASHYTASVNTDGNAQLDLHAGAPSGRYDFTLHIAVNGQDVDLDPELDLGMPAED